MIWLPCAATNVILSVQALEYRNLDTCGKGVISWICYMLLVDIVAKLLKNKPLQPAIAEQSLLQSSIALPFGHPSAE